MEKTAGWKYGWYTLVRRVPTCLCRVPPSQVSLVPPTSQSAPNSLGSRLSCLCVSQVQLPAFVRLQRTYSSIALSIPQLPPIWKGGDIFFLFIYSVCVCVCVTVENSRSVWHLFSNKKKSDLSFYPLFLQRAKNSLTCDHTVEKKSLFFKVSQWNTQTDSSSSSRDSFVSRSIVCCVCGGYFTAWRVLLC